MSDWISAGLVIIVLVAFVGALVLIDMTACSAKTADIGFSHRWVIMGGCQIEVELGRWIPLENYRLVEE